MTIRPLLAAALLTAACNGGSEADPERSSRHQRKTRENQEQQPVSSTSVCTGQLTARAFGVDRACVEVGGGRAKQTAWFENGGQKVELENVQVTQIGDTLDIQGRISQRHWIEGGLPESATAGEGVLVKLSLEERHAIRTEGAMGQHFLGRLTVVAIETRFPVGKTSLVDNLHFYAAGEHEAPHWSYEGAENGPEQWGTLAAQNEACFGQAQSPIALDLAIAARDDKKILSFEYQPSRLSVVNNGHTLLANVASDKALPNRLRTPKGAFDLLQFHIHAPSEHVMAGQEPYPIEVHLVHQQAAKAPKGATPELAVVGVFGEIKAACPGRQHGDLVGALLRTMPWDGTAVLNQAVEFSQVISPAFVLPADTTRVLSYRGSLTTPGCDERVDWYVLEQPQCFTAAEIQKIEHYLGGKNARPVQPQNGRTLTRHAP